MTEPIPVYRWQEDPGDGVLWMAQQADEPNVNATCAAKYETDQENTPRLMGYVVESHNAYFDPDPSALSQDFVFVEPPPEWTPPHRA